MSNRPFARRDASFAARTALLEAGRELRIGRLTAGLTQQQVAVQLGLDRSHVSRVERGRLGGLGLISIARHAAIVGLRPWLRLYPASRRPLDGQQLALFAAFRTKISPAWQVAIEVPMPIERDLRAADAVIAIVGCRCMVEVITRLADLQAQLRAARRKQRDLGADRLLLIVRGTATNRRAVRDAGPWIADALPLGTRACLRSLSAGIDPGADGLLLL